MLPVRITQMKSCSEADSNLADIAAHFDEREVYHWFVVAMAGYRVTNQAISWWNMVSACHDFSDASNVINCVWGAVTTCVTAAGALWGATKGIGKIQTWANNNGITFGGFKRDTVDAELLDAFSSVLNTPVTHLGVFDYAPLGLNGTFGKRESSSQSTYLDSQARKALTCTSLSWA